jgi:predicted PurR-regulated permease PerM
MSQFTRTSYVIMAILLVLVIWLKLGTLVLAALFGYFALQLFCFKRRKLLSVVIYLIAIIAIGAGMVYFTRLAYLTLPKIAYTSIPAMVNFAEKNGIDLPFTDYASMKTVALDQATEGLSIVGQYVQIASIQILFLVVGLVVAVSLFLNPTWSIAKDSTDSMHNMYYRVTQELSQRFLCFYQSFAIVIGAQLIISAINAGLTAVFLFLNGYPFATMLVMLTFLCGLLPIVGNLISNTLIVGVGFTVSPRVAIFALIFLIVIHKLEYFLNSKIVGKRINNPIWLMLIGLVLGERLMGISGMILAPVLLHYFKSESAKHLLDSIE